MLPVLNSSEAQWSTGQGEPLLLPNASPGGSTGATRREGLTSQVGGGGGGASPAVTSGI